MVHKHCQRELAVAYIRRWSFWDRRRKESINQVNDVQVIVFLSETVEEPIDVSAVPLFEKGVVLYDSRGEGALEGVIEN